MNTTFDQIAHAQGHSGYASKDYFNHTYTNEAGKNAVQGLFKLFDMLGFKLSPESKTIDLGCGGGGQ